MRQGKTLEKIFLVTYCLERLELLLNHYLKLNYVMVGVKKCTEMVIFETISFPLIRIIKVQLIACYSYL